MAEQLQVELVAADRLVWSGAATRITARTSEGDVGILRGHAPLLSVMTAGVVEIETEDGEPLLAAVDAGFISVANDRVSLLSESVDLADQIDADEARSQVEKYSDADADDEESQSALRRAQARVRAVERR